MIGVEVEGSDSAESFILGVSFFVFMKLSGHVEAGEGSWVVQFEFFLSEAEEKSEFSVLKTVSI